MEPFHRQSKRSAGRRLLDLNFLTLTPTTSNADGGTFARQFDSSADRGSRISINARTWCLLHPGPSRLPVPPFAVQRMEGVADGRIPLRVPLLGIRSGAQPPAGGTVFNNRADLIGPGVLASPIPVSGGLQLLNAASFSTPASGQLGATGRNTFTGPGFYNLDASPVAIFALRGWGDSSRLTLRADFFTC